MDESIAEAESSVEPWTNVALIAASVHMMHTNPPLQAHLSWSLDPAPGSPLLLLVRRVSTCVLRAGGMALTSLLLSLDFVFSSAEVLPVFDCVCQACGPALFYVFPFLPEFDLHRF